MDVEQLTMRQQSLLSVWLPDAVVKQNHSWGLVGTTVLELVDADGAAYIAKAGDDADHNIARELTAHEQWLEPWVRFGRAPRLVHGDRNAKLLVTEYMPGQLVESSAQEFDPGVYVQAGELLARFHGQHAVIDDGVFETQQKQKALAWLGRPHRIAADIADRLTEEVRSWPTPPSAIVPTHGDWQPRNWLIHDGRVGVIDFGRAELRPAHTDFGRLAVQQFRTNPSLEKAFLTGYGADPRDPGAWHRLRVTDAISTAGWAYRVGAEDFERQGHRMIADVIGAIGPA